MIEKEVKLEKTANIGFLKYAVRKPLSSLLSHTFLRSEKIDSNHSLDKAKEIIKNGKGVIFIINHFSLKDPSYTINEAAKHSITDRKKIIAPIAKHMDSPFYHVFGWMIGLKLKPIVTKSTKEHEKYKNYKLNDGLREYFAESIELLKKGGIVILAPQGTRMSHLGEPEDPTVGALMMQAKRKGLEGFAFLFIGFGIKGVTDYSKKRGLNLFDKYTVNIGSCLTSEEIMERAEGKFRNVDQVIFEELRKIVPEAYR